MRVNMDSSIVSDPRFKLVAQALGVNWKEVIGACFLVWTACYDRRSVCLRKVEADLAAELSGFSDALINEKLADDMGDDVVRIHGVKKRIEFLTKQAESGSKGGKSKAKKRAKHSLSEKQASAVAHAYPSAVANTHTPSPDHSPSLSPDLDHSHTPSPDRVDVDVERQGALVSASQVTRAQLESVYDRYPKKTGRAKGLDKAQRTIRSREVFEAFAGCVEAMAAAWGAPGADKQYCPGFLPFINGRRWEDDEWPLPHGTVKPMSQAQKVFALSEEMRKKEEAGEE